MKQLVSVIIPCYNVSSYIHEGLTSIINQSYKNIEIICFDDCSTDNTLEIINTFKDKDSRIKSHKNVTNLGLIATLNLLVIKCSSDIIIRMDPDDLSDKERIQKLVDAYEETKCPVISSNYRLINEYGENIKYKGLDLLNSKYGIKFTAAFNSPIPHAPALIHKSVLGKFKYGKSFKAAEDYDLWVRLLEDGFEDFHILKEELYSYRIITTSESHTLKREQVNNHYLIAKRYVNKHLSLNLNMINIKISKKILSKDEFTNLSLLDIGVLEVLDIKKTFFNKFKLSKYEMKEINTYTSEYILFLFLTVSRNNNFIKQFIILKKILIFSLLNHELFFNKNLYRWVSKRIL